MKIKTLPPASPSLESVALTDIIMNMFIFFFTSFSLIYTFNPSREARIAVNLPRAAAPAERTEAAVEITVDRAGAVFLGGAPVDMAELAGDLKRTAAAEPWRPVIVRADSHVAFERVVDILDAADGAGVERLGVAVRERPRGQDWVTKTED